MRNIARIVGIAWVAISAISILVVGFIEWIFLHDQGLIFPATGGYGEVFLLGGTAIPGWMLYQWGSAKPARKDKTNA
jgi:hypothetical protein